MTHLVSKASFAVVGGAALFAGVELTDAATIVNYRPSRTPNGFSDHYAGPGYIGGNINSALVPDEDVAFDWVGAFIIHNDVANPQYGAVRWPVVEIDLQRLRDLSTDPTGLTGATFSFAIDDIVFASSRADRPIPSFALEVYTDTADGVLTHRPDDPETSFNGDFDGGVIASVNFAADGSIEKPPLDPEFLSGEVTEVVDIAETYVGELGGNTVLFPPDFSDADFDGRGFLGFEVNITSVLSDVLDDFSVSHVGFRLVGLADDPSVTSLDRAGFEPTVAVNIVPEPASAALLAVGGMLMVQRRGRRGDSRGIHG